jgi:hypothetical protein
MQFVVSAHSWCSAVSGCLLQIYGPDALQHPYSYVLSHGQDASGDLIDFAVV